MNDRANADPASTDTDESTTTASGPADPPRTGRRRLTLPRGTWTHLTVEETERFIRPIVTSPVRVAWTEEGEVVFAVEDAGEVVDAIVSHANDGEWPGDTIAIEHDPNEHYQGAPVRIRLHARKGGDPAEWPEDLRVREFPRVEKGAV